MDIKILNKEKKAMEISNLQKDCQPCLKRDIVHQLLQDMLAEHGGSVITVIDTGQTYEQILTDIESATADN